MESFYDVSYEETIEEDLFLLLISLEEEIGELLNN